MLLHDFRKVCSRQKALHFWSSVPQHRDLLASAEISLAAQEAAVHLAQFCAALRSARQFVRGLVHHSHIRTTIIQSPSGGGTADRCGRPVLQCCSTRISRHSLAKR